MKQLGCIFIFVFSCLFLKAQEQDTPLNGEGALAFLRRHQYLPDVDYIDEFLRINQGKFAKGNSLVLGVFYQLPAKTATGTQTTRTEETRTNDFPKAKNNDSSTQRTVNNPRPQPKPDNALTPGEMAIIDAKLSGNYSKESYPVTRPGRNTNARNYAENNPVSNEESTTMPRPDNNPSSSSGREPLFGKAYENYQVVDRVLAGACFFLVSGHGGPDPGAIYYLGDKVLNEDEYAYDITLRLARNLLMHGATVHIIIQDAKDGIRDGEYLNNSDTETCMGDPIPFSQEDRLKQRCNKINNLSSRAKEKYQRAVFVHLDSRNKSEQTDIYFYHKNDSPSEAAAKTIRKTFQTQYDKFQAGRGFQGTVSTRDLYVLRNTTPASIYVEVGNIRNTFDQKRFIQSDNRQALANWFLSALIEDYQNSK